MSHPSSSSYGVLELDILDVLQTYWWLALVVAIVIYLIIANVNRNKNATAQPPQEEEEKEGKKKQSTKKVQSKDIGKKLPKLKPKKVVYSEHSLYVDCFHQGEHDANITGLVVFPDGKGLAVSSTDNAGLYRDIFKTLNPSPSATIRLPSEHASAIAVSPDATTLALATDFTLNVNLYRISDSGKAELTAAVGASQDKKEIHWLFVNSKYILTASEGSTEFHLWSLSGAKLASLNTNQMVNNMILVSPDAKFVTVAAFTSEVRVWEVCYTKSGEFDKINKAVELKGHKRGINSVSFSKDSSRLATASKDGSWKLWRINVRYHIGEDPVCELSVQTPHPSVDHIALSPTKPIAATISGQYVQFWDTTNGKLIAEIPSALHPNSKVVNVTWSADGAYFVTTTSSFVVIWKSPL